MRNLRFTVRSADGVSSAARLTSSARIHRYVSVIKLQVGETMTIPKKVPMWVLMSSTKSTPTLKYDRLFGLR